MVNSNRRRKLKQQPSQGPMQQSPPSQNTSSLPHGNVIIDNGINAPSDNDCGISGQTTIVTNTENVVLPRHEFTAMSEEIRSLKATVTTLHHQLDFVISFLGITDINSFSAHEFPPLGGAHPCLLYTSPSPRD